MARAVDLAFKAIDALLALLLFAMVVMVFGNVVLRYGFNSGIGVSEELSRYCFVWLVFIGSVSAMRRNGHLGMDALTRTLGARGRRVALAISHGLIVLCCVLMAMGTWQQYTVNATTRAPITGLSLAWVFGVAWVSAFGIGAISLHTLFGLATGRMTDAELLALGPHGETAP